SCRACRASHGTRSLRYREEAAPWWPWALGRGFEASGRIITGAARHTSNVREMDLRGPYLGLFRIPLEGAVGRQEAEAIPECDAHHSALWRGVVEKRESDGRIHKFRRRDRGWCVVAEGAISSSQVRRLCRDQV